MAPCISAKMNILGLNAFHGDPAACIVVDGQLIAFAYHP
jgi:hypothetical protein